jgi:ferredoxin hydrogenase large subunit
MPINDANIIKIKHETLYQVAKLAFEGRLEAEADNLPFVIIPGPEAHYRCCIYKEREVTRQRIRLAQSKCPGPEESDNIVQIIPSACEGCPISRYTVTDNCQNCMGKACIEACHFGAITAGINRSHIDPKKCRECGKCAQACPYNAVADMMRPCKRSCPMNAIIMDGIGIAKIDESKCIECGQCIHSCPFGAISSKSYLVQVIDAIRAGKKVYAMLAPSAEGQFGEEITMLSWKNALKKVGFTDLIELGLGGDYTAYNEAKEWIEAYEKGEKKTTSCCPAFVNIIKKHFPQLIDNISTTVSPMCAVSRKLKEAEPDCVTVFIGPCIAKKAETMDKSIEGNADYALTFGEIRAIMRAKEVKLEPAENSSQEASVFGKRFGNSGGVTGAVVQSAKELGFEGEFDVCKCNGAAECKKALMLLKMGRLPQQFIEGMACVGGCVGGPSHHRSEADSKKARDKLISQADDRNISENLEKMYTVDFNMHK